MRNPFRLLTRFEYGLWLVSLLVITASFLIAPDKDYLSLIASLIGATALIFLAKGHVLGQFLIILFALFYGAVSFYFSYYGEMLTYMGISLPVAVTSTITWIKNPYSANEVKVSRLTKRNFFIVLSLSFIVTWIFYYVLKELGNANLFISTLSVTTSFIAASLTVLRTPYYAIGYAANDIILIVLWVLASIKDISYLPMIACFVMFLFNDLYGFYSWQKMKKRQEKGL